MLCFNPRNGFGGKPLRGLKQSKGDRNTGEDRAGSAAVEDSITEGEGPSRREGLVGWRAGDGGKLPDGVACPDCRADEHSGVEAAQP
ncbi:hypothetical protein GCM10011608_58540 [Micromonospora sonchi]|uniref:Uncharacterized protein n=1 Tax=Micromonospora sonchi TaxID=1763543 RepID=A0A917UAW7_9ACTN|nr:hypothetical protein GCM10011608_58540 [Micromonospora sonchi]